MISSSVIGHGHRGVLATGKAPQAAGCIARDRNAVEEYGAAALAAAKPPRCFSQQDQRTPMDLGRRGGNYAERSAALLDASLTARSQASMTALLLSRISGL
jgi:hypothetical protein